MEQSRQWPLRDLTPVRTYQSVGGTSCRERQQSVTIDGKPERTYGTACRQPDGSWKVVNVNKDGVLTFEEVEAYWRGASG